VVIEVGDVLGVGVGLSVLEADGSSATRLHDKTRTLSSSGSLFQPSAKAGPRPPSGFTTSSSLVSLRKIWIGADDQIAIPLIMIGESDVNLKPRVAFDGKCRGLCSSRDGDGSVAMAGFDDGELEPVSIDTCMLLLD
jgi:hypothetical protein